MAENIQKKLAKDIVNRINRTRDKNSKVTIKDVMAMDERQIDYLLGRNNMNKGGKVGKSPKGCGAALRGYGKAMSSKKGKM